MTWLERVAAARARGRFSGDDHEAWQSSRTCPVGEAVTTRFGVVPGAVAWRGIWCAVNEDADRSETLSYRALVAIDHNDFAAVEQVVIEAHEAADRVKREGR